MMQELLENDDNDGDDEEAISTGDQGEEDGLTSDLPKDGKELVAQVRNLVNKFGQTQRQPL